MENSENIEKLDNNTEEKVENEETRTEEVNGDDLKKVLDELEELRALKEKFEAANVRLEAKTRTQADRLKDILLQRKTAVEVENEILEDPVSYNNNPKPKTVKSVEELDFS